MTQFPVMYNLFQPGPNFPFNIALTDVCASRMSVRSTNIMIRRENSPIVRVAVNEKYYVVYNAEKVFFFSGRLEDMHTLSDTENWTSRDLIHPMMLTPDDADRWAFVTTEFSHAKFCNANYCVFLFYGSHYMHICVLDLGSAATTWSYVRWHTTYHYAVKYAAILEVNDEYVKYAYWIRDNSTEIISRFILEKCYYTRPEAPAESFLVPVETHRDMIFHDRFEFLTHALTDTHAVFVFIVYNRVTFKFLDLVKHTVTFQSLQNPIPKFANAFDDHHLRRGRNVASYYNLRKCFILGDFIFFFVSDSVYACCAHLGPYTSTLKISWYPPKKIGHNVVKGPGFLTSAYGPWCIYKQRALMLFRWDGHVNDECEFITFFQHPSSEAVWHFHAHAINEKESSWFSLVHDSVHQRDGGVFASLFDGITV